MEEPELFKDFVDNLKNNYHDINATKEHLDMARKDALQKIKEYKELKESLKFYEKHLTESLNYINYLQKNKSKKLNKLMPLVEDYEKQLTIPRAVGQSEQLLCPDCNSDQIYRHVKGTALHCANCKCNWAE